MDWLAFGLPFEGAAAPEPTAGSVARRDAPTCRLDERLGELGTRLAPGWSWCAVVNEAGNVLGLMPHPEHAVDPLTGSDDGLKLFGALAGVAA